MQPPILAAIMLALAAGLIVAWRTIRSSTPNDESKPK